MQWCDTRVSNQANLMKRLSFTILTVLTALGMLSATDRAVAHEYWFEPESFFVKTGEMQAVHLYVGDGFAKDRQERPFQPAHTPAFHEISKAGVRDLVAGKADGTLPVHTFSALKSGNYLLAMERDWFSIQLEARKFEDYLREEGMEYIIAERRARGESEREGRERYSRYIKALLQVGDTRDDTYAVVRGMRLEIIPLQNPYARRIGDTLAFQVRFEGKPLPRSAVFADTPAGTTQKLTTDERGQAVMKITGPGLWLIRLVHMQRCKSDCAKADWESFWGAYSFGAR